MEPIKSTNKGASRIVKLLQKFGVSIWRHEVGSGPRGSGGNYSSSKICGTTYMTEVIWGLEDAPKLLQEPSCGTVFKISSNQ